jgi:hypothetical protein
LDKPPFELSGGIICAEESAVKLHAQRYTESSMFKVEGSTFETISNIELGTLNLEQLFFLMAP